MTPSPSWKKYQLATDSTKPTMTSRTRVRLPSDHAEPMKSSAPLTAATRTVILRSNDLKSPDRFVVEKAESGLAEVTAAIKPTDKKGEFELTLQVAKDAKPGTLDGSVLVHTNDSIKPLVTIPVKGTVKAAQTAAAGAK